jgi:hypothetical protein
MFCLSRVACRLCAFVLHNVVLYHIEHRPVLYCSSMVLFLLVGHWYVMYWQISWYCYRTVHIVLSFLAVTTLFDRTPFCNMNCTGYVNGTHMDWSVQWHTHTEVCAYVNTTPHTKQQHTYTHTLKTYTTAQQHTHRTHTDIHNTMHTQQQPT